MPIVAVCNLKVESETDLHLETYVLEDTSFMIFYNYFLKNKLHSADILHEFI
jgi:hypothetical protein